MNPAFLGLVVAIVWSSEGARSITTITMTTSGTTTNGTNVMMSYATNRMNDRQMMNLKMNVCRRRTRKLAVRRYDSVCESLRSSGFDYLLEVAFSGICLCGLAENAGIISAESAKIKLNFGRLTVLNLCCIIPPLFQAKRL
ncbi:MAG: hypothetical protein KA368_15300 [Acidobacteria bacterium]|nr:hypothetical protein [Acidobacteriota bacterium]